MADYTTPAAEGLQGDGVECDPAWVERVVGRPAWAVWTALLSACDPVTRENWMRRATLAVRTGLRTESQVHDALKRLSALRLVAPGRWRRKPRGKTSVVVRTRIVRGELRGGAAWVPEDAYFVMVQRRGRGRPPENTPPTDTLSLRESPLVFGLPSEAQTTAGAADRLVFPLSAKLAVPGIPPRPVVDLARVPSPPLALPEDDDDAADWVVALYADLRLQRHGTRFGWRGPLRRQKWWKALRDGVAAIRERDLPPVHWIGWSFAMWGGKGAPSLAWVLSPKRMDERAGWFSAESDGVAFGGRVCPTPASLALWERWRAMEDALYQIGPATPNQLREAAARHLTVGDAAALTERATEEAQQMRQQMKQDVARGRWVW